MEKLTISYITPNDSIRLVEFINIQEIITFYENGKLDDIEMIHCEIHGDFYDDELNFRNPYAFYIWAKLRLLKNHSNEVFA